MEFDAEKLVFYVEARKPLYDYTLKEYSNRELVEELWEEIATLMNATVAECKSKWSNLRNSYARVLRDMRNTTVKKKKRWYLSDSMSFLEEFMCQHKKTEHNSVDSPQFVKIEKEWNTTNDDEDTTRDNSEDEDDDIIKLPIKEPRNIQKRSGPSFRMKSRHFEHAEDPDVSFFKSMIPDFKKLTAKRQRQFKMSMLSTLNGLVDEQEENSFSIVNNDHKDLQSTND